MCDMASMGEIVDLSAIRDALRRQMERKGLKAKPLAKRAGLGETAVRDFLNNDSADVRMGTLVRLASVLDCDLEELVGQPRVQLAGYIGAGGSVIFEEPLPDEEPVLRPPALSGPVIALEVRGDSMLPKYEPGDIIYIQRQHEGVLPEYIGEYCAVRLTSGETFLKKMAFGSKEGVYTLISLNAADMPDVEIDWATPVLFVMPRRSRTIN